MPRSLLPGLLLLASVTASAALPIAPLEPRIGPLPTGALDPAAATSGTTTLVAWTGAFGRHPAAQRVHARLLGVHDAAVEIGQGAQPQVGWNGNEYLIADSVAATIVHADGTTGTRRLLNPSALVTVNAVAWTGQEWAVGFVTGGNGRVMLLDRELNAARTIELGAARSVRLTTIDGAVWVVHQRDADTEVFAIGTEEPRFRLAGHARMAGRIAIIEETIRLSILDPRSGFPEPRPFLASFEIPLELVHAETFGSGALFAIYSPVGGTLLLVTVDANGSRQEYTAVLTGAASTPQVAVAGSTIFLGVQSQIYGFPLQPWPQQPFALTGDAIVSISNFAQRRDPTIASNGTYALAFWNERTTDISTEAAFMRAVDANGVPFGPVTQLPFAFNFTRDAAFYGDRFVLVWREDDGGIRASAGGTPVVIGYGGVPAVARGPQGSFAVWRNDGVVLGTPLRDDASPVVPGGFPLSPAGVRGDPAIAVVPQGFHVLWPAENVTSAIVSPDGTLLSTSVLGGPTDGRVVAGGSLAAWPGMFATIEGHSVPFDGSPVMAIHPLDDGRHLVTVALGTVTQTRLVTVAGGKIVDVTQPRLFLDRAVFESSVTVIDGKPLAVYDANGQVWVASYPVRRRAVR